MSEVVRRRCFPIPKDVSQSYQIHNGSGQLPLLAFDSYQIPFPIASISTMRAQWAFIQKGLNRGSFTGTDFVNDPQGPIQKVWFHSKWLPVVDNQGGDYVFVDLAPAKGGKKGQVIDFFRHKGASHVLAPSFSELLEGIATDLDSGKFRVDKKAKSLVAVRSGK